MNSVEHEIFMDDTLEASQAGRFYCGIRIGDGCFNDEILSIPTIIVGDAIVARGLIPADELLKLIKKS